MGSNESRLLTFHDEYCLVGIAVEKVFAKETLAQVEVGQTQLSMYPAYMWVWNFQPMPGLCIISHNLTCTYFSIGVYLPKDCRTVPFLGSPHLIKIEESFGIASTNRIGQEKVQRIGIIT